MLTPRQRQALQLEVAGARNAEICAKARVSERMLDYWRQNAEYQRAREEMLQQAYGAVPKRLQALVHECVATLEAEVRNGGDRKVEVALALLKGLGFLREEVSVERQVELVWRFEPSTVSAPPLEIH